MNKDLKFKSGLAHPLFPLKAWLGAGFHFSKECFSGVKTIVILNFTKRTAAAKRGRVSLYAELFQDLSSVE